MATKSCPVDPQCTHDIDIVLRSKDGKSFGASMALLSTFSNGFPAPHVVSPSSEIETVDMEEDAEVVELMLRYTHPMRPPSSALIEGSTMIRLAEAIEKYEIYSAQDVCEIQMIALSREFPLEVFLYSVKHDIKRVRDTSVEHTIDVPLEKVWAALVGINRLDMFAAWVRYREQLSSYMAYQCGKDWNNYHKAAEASANNRNPLVSSASCRWKDFTIKVMGDMRGQRCTKAKFFEVVQAYEKMLGDYDVRANFASMDGNI